MNKLEKGLCVIGVVTSLLGTGIAISDVVKISKGKKDSGYALPVISLSAGCLIAGAGRTAYNKYLKKDSDKYQTKK